MIVRWQHTFVAVGYDEEGVYLVDAYDGATKHFSYEAFDSAWTQLGRQAVTVAGVQAQPARWTRRAAGRDGRFCFVADDRWTAGPE